MKRSRYSLAPLTGCWLKKLWTETTISKSERILKFILEFHLATLKSVVRSDLTPETINEAFFWYRGVSNCSDTCSDIYDNHRLSLRDAAETPIQPRNQNKFTWSRNYQTIPSTKSTFTKELLRAISFITTLKASSPPSVFFFCYFIWIPQLWHQSWKWYWKELRFVHKNEEGKMLPRCVIDKAEMKRFKQVHTQGGAIMDSLGANLFQAFRFGWKLDERRLFAKTSRLVSLKIWRVARKRRILACPLSQ